MGRAFSCACAAQAAAADGSPAVQHAGGEANLVLPDLGSVEFQGINGRTLLMAGLGVCVLGLVFGLVIYNNLKNLPVHRSMLEISELIYETCKTYLVTQGRFILMLWVFIGIISAVYFGGLAATVDPVTGAVVHGFPPFKVGVILLFSLVGIAGSYGVAWFGIRVNTFANSRAAFAGLEGRPFPIYAIPLKAGMSIGMLLISVELLIMLCILLFIPGDYAGSCFIGFAIGESLGAAALRIAGGIFTKIADIGADLMKIVFNIKEDDARNPGRHRRLHRRQRRRLGRAERGRLRNLRRHRRRPDLLHPGGGERARPCRSSCWSGSSSCASMGVIASGASYLINESWATAASASAATMNFETPLTTLVWLTSIVSVIADLHRVLLADRRHG